MKTDAELLAGLYEACRMNYLTPAQLVTVEAALASLNLKVGLARALDAFEDYCGGADWEHMGDQFSKLVAELRKVVGSDR